MFTESIICVNLVTTSHVDFISISNIVLSSFWVSPRKVKILLFICKKYIIHDLLIYWSLLFFFMKVKRSRLTWGKWKFQRTEANIISMPTFSFFGSQLLPYNTATESTVKVGCILITITRLLFCIYSN